ncbi:MAG: TIGR02757 family protein [Chitinophagaceae bacterium]
MGSKSLKYFLDEALDRYNTHSFVASDPVSIPHLFEKKQDQEIAGFFAAIFSWGNRPMIIRKSTELMQLMKMSPYDFCMNHNDDDLRSLLDFKHRTFNPTDLLYFVEFFKYHYSRYESLESAFTIHGKTIREMLMGFHDYFFSLEDAPKRTRKHISTPARNSTCKRLNMFLRWMVRSDGRGVDLGIWKNISPSILICPVDLHVARVARQLRLLTRTQTDWQAAEELTAALRKMDKNDPVKYDLALFGLGVIEKFG